MANSTEFLTWLADLSTKGYDHHWIRRNMPALEKRFRENPAPMVQAPQPSVKAKDRYKEL